jgi:hypothetical protein
VASDQRPDLSLFLDNLLTLESIEAPYMIIGAFAAAVYGTTRVTYDIDIVVNLEEKHISALTAAYPSPRYYADPVQMRDSIQMGIMFNIIDTDRGEKADLVPLTMDSRYHEAFQRRVRQRVEVPGAEPFEVWCARPEDVIIGKLMAWEEGRSRKHETDIFEMMVFHYLGADSSAGTALDESYVDAQAKVLTFTLIFMEASVKPTALLLAESERGANPARWFSSLEGRLVGDRESRLVVQPPTRSPSSSGTPMAPRSSEPQLERDPWAVSRWLGPLARDGRCPAVAAGEVPLAPANPIVATIAPFLEAGAFQCCNLS